MFSHTSLLADALFGGAPCSAARQAKEVVRSPLSPHASSNCSLTKTGAPPKRHRDSSQAGGDATRRRLALPDAAGPPGSRSGSPAIRIFGTPGLVLAPMRGLSPSLASPAGLASPTMIKWNLVQARPPPRSVPRRAANVSKQVGPACEAAAKAGNGGSWACAALGLLSLAEDRTGVVCAPLALRAALARPLEIKGATIIDGPNVPFGPNRGRPLTAVRKVIVAHKPVLGHIYSPGGQGRSVASAPQGGQAGQADQALDGGPRPDDAHWSPLLVVARSLRESLELVTEDVSASTRATGAAALASLGRLTHEGEHEAAEGQAAEGEAAEGEECEPFTSCSRKWGGTFGCSLKANHDGPHQFDTSRVRDRSRSPAAPSKGPAKRGAGSATLSRMGSRRSPKSPHGRSPLGRSPLGKLR